MTPSNPAPLAGPSMGPAATAYRKNDLVWARIGARNRLVRLQDPTLCGTLWTAVDALSGRWLAAPMPPARIVRPAGDRDILKLEAARERWVR